MRCDDPRKDIARQVAVHSLFWLLAANLVGVWLALVLFWPEAGDHVAPLTYGRWMPLHLNWQLYGWCSLPLVGILCFWFLDERHPHVYLHVRLLLAGWSLALALGGASWLAGMTGGKLFLDWRGPGLWLLSSVLLALWTVLAAHTWWRWPRLGRIAKGGRLGLLAGLLAVPPVLFLSARPDVYPAVNPDSGGATGAALLGSTLGIISLFGFLPLFLQRKRTRPATWFWCALAASWACFLLMDHGSTSHRDRVQIAGLGVLVVWGPLLILYWRKFDWPEGVRSWLGAAYGWWLLLVVTGWLTFLPGISEPLKFTNGLVAHAHLAMAGLVTSVNAVILRTLGGGMRGRPGFWLWHLGCAGQVLLLLVLGFQESAGAAALFRSENWTQWFYAGRLGCGVAMTLASVLWWKEVWK